MRVAVIGHVEWIWFGAVDRIPGPGEIAHATDDWEEPGGGGAVAAVQLSKLAGACDFLTALGDDELGERATKELAGLGLTMHVATRADRTRRALTLVDPAGERTITTLGRRLEPRGEDDLPWELLDGADAVYVTAGDAGAFRRARRARVLVVTSRALEELLDADVVPDALVGSGNDPAEHVDPELMPWRPRLLVRTEGTSGGRYETASGQTGRYEAVEVSRGLAADAYGAGDSFAAGLTFGLGQGLPPPEALALAASRAAAALARVGAHGR